MLDPNESLARFLTSRTQFSRLTNRVKYSAFMPKDGATSVFRISELDDQEIWELGDLHVASPPERPVRGYADLTVLDVRSLLLEVDPDDEPPRHAGIVNWPEEKESQKLVAIDLAAVAALKLRPSAH
jgi:hypothetical protein